MNKEENRKKQMLYKLNQQLQEDEYEITNPTYYCKFIVNAKISAFVKNDTDEVMIQGDLLGILTLITNIIQSTKKLLVDRGMGEPKVKEALESAFVDGMILDVILNNKSRKDRGGIR